MSKAERTKQFIIEKAAPIINRKGMAGTSISDIMEATQMAKGGIYGNFESKEDICSQALDYLINGLNRSIEARIAGIASARTQLFTLLDYYKSLHASENFGGCPMFNFGTEADDTNAEIKEKIAKSISHTEARFVRIVKKGIADGEFKKSFDAETFSIMAFTMIEGALWASRMMNSSKQIKVAVEFLKKQIDDHSK